MDKGGNIHCWRKDVIPQRVDKYLWVDQHGNQADDFFQFGDQADGIIAMLTKDDRDSLISGWTVYTVRIELG